MGRDINGNYTLPAGNPVAPGTLIESTWANSTLSDVAAALSDSLSRSGSGGMLAPFYNTSGSIGAPGVSWKDEPTSGWYRKNLNEFWYVVGGFEIFGITAAGVMLAPGKGFSGLTTLTSPLQINSTLGVLGLLTATGGIHAVADSDFDGNVDILGALTAASIAGAFSGSFNGTVGAATPNTGAFTTVAASGLISANGGVAGAVNGTVGAATPNTGAFTTVAASGLISANGGVAGAVNGTVGAATPNTGSFTTLGASGLATLTGGAQLGNAILLAAADPGTAGQHLASAGAGAVPVWTNAAAGDVTLNGVQTLTNKTMTGVKETSLAMPADNIDILAANYFTKTISGATSLTVSNVGASPSTSGFILELTNGGSAAITWWSGVKWAGGTVPTLTAAGRDVLGFFTHDNVTWTGMVLSLDVK